MLKKCGLLLTFFAISRAQLPTSESLDKTLDMYEHHVNVSLDLEKQDYDKIKAWSEDFQVKMVDITTRFRMAMIKHQRHYFKPRAANERWMYCLDQQRNRTTKSEQVYYLKENMCLKQASSSDEQKRDAISQVGREIRKWRRSYRYLNNLCYTNNPDNIEKAGVCFIQYMERDRYIYAFQRLINLRIVLVDELYKSMQITLDNLERCLNTQFSKYLERVRNTMEVLNSCYGVDGVGISGFKDKNK
ncbi:uncharacterized protein LOC126369999 [Pectinophora gossypiella]|uniref:uncharacterized protein LOC126369999 n=1 Tax=Pectinophora gossypiella TaxID=13191 RepID=UPI00214E1425|nr:uncharacterized protein LOC126369999 [Pectinophora gossypiella]